MLTIVKYYAIFVVVVCIAAYLFYKLACLIIVIIEKITGKQL